MIVAATVIPQEAITEGGHTMIWVSAMTSFVTLVGVVVTGFVQWSASREVTRASRAAAVAATEAKVTAMETKATNDKIETLVNSRSDKQDKIIEDLTRQLAASNAAALAKAEASPAIVPPEPLDET